MISPDMDLGIEAIFWAVTISNVVAVIGVSIYSAYMSRRGLFVRVANRSPERIDGD